MLKRLIAPALLFAMFCTNSPAYETLPHPYPEYFYYITATSSGALFACTEHTGIYRSTDSGLSFDYMGLPEMYLHHIEEGPDGAVYVCTVDEGVFRSRDQGETWTQITEGLGDNPTALDFLFLGDTILTGTNNGVFASEDGGDHWRQTGMEGIEARGFLQLSNGTILCTGRRDGLFRSTDNGESWEPLPSNLPESVDAHKLGEYTDGVLILATWGEGVWRSPDYGATWAQVLAIPDDPRVDFVVMHSGGIYVTSHNEGVYVSSDGGYSWNRAFQGLPWRVKYLEFTVGSAFAVTWGSGIRRSDNGGATWTPVPAGGYVPPVLVEDRPPALMTLAAGPNPFNSAVTITCTLPSEQQAELAAYSILGQRVATLAAGRMNAGAHTFVWNAGEFSSGAYFVVLQGAFGVMSERVTMVK